MKRFLKANAAKLAAFMGPRKDAPTRAVSAPRPLGVVAEGAWVLEFDIPAWDFRKGEQVRVFPDAPVYLGDVVALRTEHGELKLARYRDEYIHAVAGLAVRV